MPSHLSVETIIEAPPETVWLYTADLDTWAKTVSAIVKVEKLTDGPVGVGTRFRETRVMFGREASEEMTIVEFAEPHRMAFDADSHGCAYHSVMRFEPHADGHTRAIVEFNASPHTLGARVMSLLMGFMMKGSICKALEGDLADIKQACEAHGDLETAAAGA
jgi:uncharacterized protein YndB with AHSA1/START domain